MSDSSYKPWSDNPNAPKIPYEVYISEKSTFAGTLIGAIFYGIVIVLFFQCMEALFHPANRTRRGVKWGLVAHTVAMFLFATVYTAMSLDIQSISYIDNREFPGVAGLLPPGPVGYRFSIYPKPISVVPGAMFLLNNWLADGLLLYRCYVVYSKNRWFVAFPCIMYLSSLPTGILLIYQTSQPTSIWDSFDLLGIPYFSISVSLNILLTLMIVTRLVFHSRSIRDAMGPLVKPARLYKAVIAILVESSALYAVNSILFIGPWAAKDRAAGVFLPILAEIQVIAPFLIILRVANKRAFTTSPSTSGAIGSIHITNGRSSGGTNTDDRPMSPVDAYRKSTGMLGVEVETVINYHHDKV